MNDECFDQGLRNAATTVKEVSGPGDGVSK